ncbi:MAG TPA: DUF3445 domain-containing protein [Methylophaga aminisulfidivorans]|uniref:DUF3445 domain-containing protein n=1 Tax=Methylophaga aminisulfidivorans MP TaxID=1026882 RepID=F5T349_9GAMM|nr:MULTISPECIES: DUF3445 domain-containing protein [Methylophaga]EGL53475.1 hypothetical Protein MAMP_01124 [Methylophaga aminisulfidivorans MP]HIC46559.1 DUF3445 domain-containing protein [Methylophaga sp.]HIM39166.1 DUF3445 domain-containing protein [Methylophaga aminisulfidivorans]
MNMAFNEETFRGDFTFRNSPESVRRFPYPFEEDEYMYSVNIEQHTPGAPGSVFEHPIDVDEHYVAECKERAIVLSEDHTRCVALPHMMDAQWDTLELVMTSLSESYPSEFQLTIDGDNWHWVNKPLGIEDRFVFGDVSTLPMEPFEYVMRQVQGDWVIMDQRDNDLYADLGMVTGQADWSVAFDAGMSFKEWHAPVPHAPEMGIFDRALKYLLHLQYGSPVRRTNWRMCVNPRLDTSSETYDVWGTDNVSATKENAGDKVFLRVELQALFRLPRSNAIAFSIRTYMVSLADLATYPRWAKRLNRVLRSLHPDLAEYKGLNSFKQPVLDWLEPLDDGAFLEKGTHPE